MRVSALLLSSTKFVKESTGIVGLRVVPNAREVLIALYEKMLRDVQIIPSHVQYRQAIEQLAARNLDILHENTEVPDIEFKIGLGQVEELIDQAKNELQLIPKFAEWRSWEEKPIEPGEEQWEEFAQMMENFDEAKVEAHSLSESQLEWLRERRAKKEEERKHMEAHNAERKTGGPREQKNE